MGFDLVGFVLLIACLALIYWAHLQRNLRLVGIGILALFVVGLIFFRVKEIEQIKLGSDVLFQLGPLGVTNSLLATWVTMLLLLVLSLLATRNMQLVPTGLQNVMEAIIEALRDLVYGATDSRDKADRFLPLVATFFLFILLANWLGLVPGFTTLEVVVPGEAPHASVGKVAGDAGAAETGHHVPLFKPATTDLNTTLALAVVSVFMSQFWGIKYLGATEYMNKFFTIRGGPIGTFVGLLEFVSEVAKLISFSFRLFGNIFAGEVLLIVIGFLIPFGASLPFLGLELFVGFIQAFVFAMLTLVFLVMATTGHGHDEHGHEHGPVEAPSQGAHALPARPIGAHD